MPLIEGVGDEVVVCFCFVVVVVLLFFAWFSTRVQPIWSNNNSVWLVQMQTWPHNRVLQMFHVDEAVADQITNDPNTRTVRIDANVNSGDDLLEATLENASISVTNGGSSGTLEVDPTQSSATESSESVESIHRTNFENEESEPKESIEAKTEENTNNNVVNEDHEDLATLIGDTQIRLKFLDETQKLVETFLTKSVGEFKRQHFGSEVNNGKVIRLIYQGQLLRDDGRSLESYGLHDNCIVHCHVSNTPLEGAGDRSDYSAAAATGLRYRVGRGARGIQGVGARRRDPHGAIEAALEPGRYFNLLFALIFIGIWALYVAFPQYFDFASFFALILISVIYCLTMVMSRRRAERERRHAAGLPPAQEQVGAQVPAAN